MAEPKKKKEGGGKGGENTLNLIGTILGMVGGREGGIDLGAPFRAGAAMMKEKREQNNLLELLGSNPHTAPIAAVAPALYDAGGIANNLDLLEHPEVQGALGGGEAQASAAPQGEPIPPPAGALPTASPLLNTLKAQQTPAAPLDFTSDAFLQRAAQLRPDLAEAILTKRATAGQGDQLDAVLKALKIKDYESPEQKRKAKLEERQTMLEATDKLIGDRQEQNQIRTKEIAAQSKREEWTPKEDENFNTVNQSIDEGRMLFQRAAEGLTPDFMTAMISKNPIGQLALQRLAPDQAAMVEQLQTFRDLTKKVMTDVKAQSGAAYSAKELEWMQSALPQAGDTPEQFKNSIASDLLKKQWLNLNTIATKVQKAGNTNPAKTRGIGVDQLKAFSILKKQLATLPAKGKGSAETVFKNPANAPYLKTLGMDYFITPQ